MSSDFLSRPVDVARHDLIYAGAQKNAGPAGVTIVIAHKSKTRGYAGRAETPKILRYQTQAENDSMYNTPNTFGIYVAGLVAEWVAAEGGLVAMAEQAAAKAKALYDLIDEHPLYSGHAEPGSRSLMNVTFRLQNAAQEKALLAAAEARGIIGLKGHRSVGGLRASIYNAVPMRSVEALVALMKDFAPRSHGPLGRRRRHRGHPRPPPRRGRILAGRGGTVRLAARRADLPAPPADARGAARLRGAGPRRGRRGGPPAFRPHRPQDARLHGGRVLHRRPHRPDAGEPVATGGWHRTGRARTPHRRSGGPRAGIHLRQSPAGGPGSVDHARAEQPARGRGDGQHSGVDDLLALHRRGASARRHPGDAAVSRGR
jgi:hypothetical protein